MQRSCKALAKQLAGASDAAALNALEPMQNADGGFGAATGLASNPQDTAWALRALHANRKSGVSATKALAWVQSNQQSEGSWKLVPDGDTLVPTALMAQTLVLYRYQQTSTQAALTKAQTWLVSQRNAAQTWADEQRTAQGLLAVLPGLDAFTTMEPTLAALRQSQRADGSWAGDPYVTALALRALALAALGPQNPGDPVTTGTLQGTTQGANGQPLAGVVVAAVSAAGGAPKLATSDAQGNYAITGIPAGPVSISAAKDGYSQINASGTIVAGQVLMFSPVLTSVVTVTPPGTPPPQGTTTATVSGTVKDGAGQPLAGAVITATPIGGSAVTATTNAQGAYSLTVPAGTLKLNASKAGYLSVDASGTLPVGSTADFSPTLISSSTPGATQVAISGQVVAADSRAPLAAVTVTAETSGGAPVTVSTDSNGRFALNAAAGSIKLSYTKAGYTSVVQQATAQAGAKLDAGLVLMPVARSTSSLRGVVTNMQGAPIAGATVQAAGVTAKTNAAGAYVIPEFSGTSVSVAVSATGFLSRTYQLTIATPGDIVQDFVLPEIGGSGFLELDNLKVTPASAGLNQEVVVSVTVRNTSTTEAESAVMLEVQDPSGKVLAQLSGLDSTNTPIGTLTLAPGAQAGVKFNWNTASAPAGTYTLLVKLYVPGSRNTQNPTGTVTGSLLGQLVISQTAHFSGTAMADPPVVQAGATTPVKLSALVRNDGNVSLPASEYRLAVRWR